MNAYELHSWSAQYRRERLAEARRQHLEEKVKATHQPRGLRHLDSTWKNVLTSLRATHTGLCRDGWGRSLPDEVGFSRQDDRR